MTTIKHNKSGPFICVQCLHQSATEEEHHHHARVHRDPFGGLGADDPPPLVDVPSMSSDDVRLLLEGGVPCDVCYVGNHDEDDHVEEVAEFYHDGQMMCPGCVRRLLEIPPPKDDRRDWALGVCEGALEVAVVTLGGNEACAECRDVASALAKVRDKISGVR